MTRPSSSYYQYWHVLIMGVMLVAALVYAYVYDVMWSGPTIDMHIMYSNVLATAVENTVSGSDQEGQQVETSKTPDDGARIAFITFSHLIDFSRFEKYIFPALDTYLADDIYHVVLRNEWKDKYYLELCNFNETYADYCKRVRPIFVNCPEAKFGESPCCKQEKGLLQILDGPHRYDWYAYYDDDVYLRRRPLKSFLGQFSPSSVMLVTTGGRVARSLGQSSYLQNPKYKCTTTNNNYTYPWGQPVFYTHGALTYISNGLRAGGLVKQCNEFEVTHDAGNAVLHWMFSIPEVRIRIFLFPNREDPKSFGSHGIEHLTRERLDGKRQPPGQKPGRQQLNMSITPGMKEVHGKFLRMGYTETEVKWHNVTGFTQTSTYQRFGDSSTWGSEWHTMPVADCITPEEGTTQRR